MDHNKLWKILKEVGIPDHLTCLLRNVYAGQEATVRPGHGTTDFPGGSDGKVSAYNTGDPGSIPGLGRSPGEGKGYPLQYSGLENSMDRICIVHGVAKSWTRRNDFHFTSLHFTLYIS